MTDTSHYEQEMPPQRSGMRRHRREHLHSEEEAEGLVRNGRVVVEYNGKIYTRRRVGNTDPFAIPPHIIPEGWDYQWNVVTVVGQQAVDAQIHMSENGWEPVPCGRHPGMFMPAGYPEHSDIIRGGLRLECRPIQLTEEARDEDQREARRLIRDRDEQLGLGRNPDFRLGRGHEHRNFLAGGRSGVRRSVDPGYDIPGPAPVDIDD